MERRLEEYNNLNSDETGEKKLIDFFKENKIDFENINCEDI